MSENFEDRYEDSFKSSGFSINFTGDTVISSGNHSDTISCYGANDILGYFGNHSYINGASSSDTITFNLNMSEDTNKNGFWKYNEDKILKQLEEYISSTYRQHYVDRTGGGKEQTLDKIKHNRREGFCAGNVTKYIDRYDTKGTPRADLFKVLHYTILLINHLNLIENK